MTADPHKKNPIRDIQVLMAVLSCLPSNGKLAQVLRSALEADEGAVLSRMQPVTDTSNSALRDWLEALWSADGITDAERQLIEWQNNGDNMDAAIAELDAVQQKSGLRLTAQTG